MVRELDLCPLSPYMDEEMFFGKDLSIDGGAIEKLGFEYLHKEIKEEDCWEMVNSYVELGIFPKGLLKEREGLCAQNIKRAKQ
jgi:hypothetical protein